MRPIERSEILSIGDYETIRERFRARVIEEKRRRRVALGDRISAVFENRDTVLLQIQEMLRTERITSEHGIAHEIETYNELLPGAGQLSITLFVEIPDKAERERMLVELAGLEDAAFLEVGGERAPLRGRRDGASPGRTTAVHYLKVELPAAARAPAAFVNSKPVLVLDHPRYQARAELGPATVDVLAKELSASGFAP